MNSSLKFLIGTLMLLIPFHGQTQELFKAPPDQTHTRWVSPENLNGEKGQGGKSNLGAKGNAFLVVKPGAKQVLFDVRGAGIIHRMWLSGTIPRNEEQGRAVRIDMFWDGASQPAVSAPIADFFGAGLGLAKPFQSALFSNPEGRSFNFTIPMPFRTSARIEITNESSSYVLIWYDINFTTVEKHAADVMYFHAHWNREVKTASGKDFTILPRVKGKGRYLGAVIGVVGNPAYRGTWFGEGEVKVYLDGDSQWPTLVGTGTEDYIGSGWGQGEYAGPFQGSLVADHDNDLYSFYRFHLPDPVYFHEDCRVTLQQIGNTSAGRVKEMLSKRVETKPLWMLDTRGEDILNMKGVAPEPWRLLERPGQSDFNNATNPEISTHFYRQDDVSAVAYFYLDRPQNDLEPLQDVAIRLIGMKATVWDKQIRK